MASITPPNEDHNSDKGSKNLEDNPKLEAGRRDSTSEPEYPKGWKLWSILVGLALSVLCTALDKTIISTAIPKITTAFNSLDDVGWYGSVYLLTACCFQLMIGKLYAEFSIKVIFLLTLSIFEIGSIVCASAPNSPAFIAGRAIAGLGSSGVATGALIILAHSAPLEKRPKYTGAIGASMGIASCVAPTLGGVLTDKASWRWCFWINPILGVPTVIVVFFLINLPSKTPRDITWSEFLAKFDFLGTAFLLPGLVCLLLALQWGGSTYAWSDWRSILLLCLFGVCITIWMYVQVRQGDKATLPLRILKNRSMGAATWYMFCVFGALTCFTYYGSIWFQSVKQQSAYSTGIYFLAATATMSVVALCSGVLTSKIGYYVPQMIACCIICPVGYGLLHRFSIDTSTAYWAGTLVIIGFGFGLGGQQSIMVPQTVMKGPDISLGTSCMMFAQTIAGTVLLSASQNVFEDNLVLELRRIVPDVDPNVVIGHGASGLAKAMSAIYDSATVHGILVSYNLALTQVWTICLVMCCLGSFGALTVEWKSVKSEKAPVTDAEIKLEEVLPENDGRPVSEMGRRLETE
ncbi:MFS general substrate transporter [Cryphonectria parasitica EP155]|uniref:MFS general substrate transporter n=1 Tax=Cryphonectria parasitica (strain ATCC 38755 / EP155) TaxID=660469 RepID=A0A9P4Y7D5_CRYP1|nr:MFS general substrate transporter [Cryphonectria parasitica EP155]KAF3768091.1 MFS general substrate transporter [Cryphonectria parasitica EP155]